MVHAGFQSYRLISLLILLKQGGLGEQRVQICLVRRERYLKITGASRFRRICVPGQVSATISDCQTLTIPEGCAATPMTRVVLAGVPKSHDLDTAETLFESLSFCT